MPSDVYINNQVQALQLVTNVSGGLDSSHYTIRPGPINFGQNVVYLSFDRSEGIKNGKTYVFTTVFAVGAIQYTVTISLTGTFLDSNFWIQVSGTCQGNTKQTKRLDDHGSDSFELGFSVPGQVNNPMSGADYSAVSAFNYRLLLERFAGTVHDDVRITISPTTQSFTGNLPLSAVANLETAALEVSLPAETTLEGSQATAIELLDVWGEGRIVDGQTISGFVEAYNLNKDTQNISNGPNSGKAIPNKLPVSEYNNPKFPLGDGSVKFITLMGAPITAGVAQEMYRVLNKQSGVVFLYDPNSNDQKTFEANKGKLIYKPSDPLPAPFDQPTFRPVLIYGFPGVVDHDEL
jgi:hypothetical protein